MMFPCEIVLKKFVPAMKAETARILTDDYGLSQVEIARELGITQAAVSKYLSGKVSAEVGEAGQFVSVRAAAESLASSIGGSKSIKLNPVDPICACCREMRRTKVVEFGVVKDNGMRISSACDVKL